MELRMIKLVTGEVVIGKELEAVVGEGLRLAKPMTLMLDPMQGGVGMIPYDAIYTQVECEKYSWKTEHIIDPEMPIHESFEEAYIKQTTGIELDAGAEELPIIEVE